MKELSKMKHKKFVKSIYLVGRDLCLPSTRFSITAMLAAEEGPILFPLKLKQGCLLQIAC